MEISILKNSDFSISCEDFSRDCYAKVVNGKVVDTNNNNFKESFFSEESNGLYLFNKNNEILVYFNTVENNKLEGVYCHLQDERSKVSKITFSGEKDPSSVKISIISTDETKNDLDEFKSDMQTVSTMGNKSDLNYNKMFFAYGAYEGIRHLLSDAEQLQKLILCLRNLICIKNLLEKITFDNKNKYALFLFDKASINDDEIIKIKKMLLQKDDPESEQENLFEHDENSIKWLACNQDNVHLLKKTILQAIQELVSDKTCTIYNKITDSLAKSFNFEKVEL